MSPIRPFPILLQPLLLVEPFNFAARDHRREPACGDQHAERDDEERQVEVGDRISSDDRRAVLPRGRRRRSRGRGTPWESSIHNTTPARASTPLSERSNPPHSIVKVRPTLTISRIELPSRTFQKFATVKKRDWWTGEEGDQDQQDGEDAEIAEQRLPEAASSRASSPYLRHFRPCRRRSATRFARPTPRPAATRPRAAARA